MPAGVCTSTGSWLVLCARCLSHRAPAPYTPKINVVPNEPIYRGGLVGAWTSLDPGAGGSGAPTMDMRGLSAGFLAGAFGANGIAACALRALVSSKSSFMTSCKT